MTAADGGIRPHYRAFADWLERTDASRIAQKREEAERAFHRVGITFAVYGEDAGTERLIPFDIVPRIIPADEWEMLERGLKQRVHALNLFLADVYHDQKILKSGAIPADACSATRSTGARWRAWTSRAGSTRTSPAWTSCAPARASTTCWRTTCACRPASRTCSRTAR